MSTNLTEFEELVAIDVDAPTPIVTFAVRQSIIEFCEETWIMTKDFNYVMDDEEVEDEINDYIDINLAEFAADTRPLGIVTLFIDGTQWDTFHKEIVVDIPDYTSVFSSEVKFFSFPNNSTLRLYNIASTSTNITLAIAFKPIQTVTAIDDFMYEDWLEPIVAGAKYRLLSMPNKEWSDPASAIHNLTLFKSGASKAKKKMNKGFSKKSTSVQPRSFGNHM